MSNLEIIELKKIALTAKLDSFNFSCPPNFFHPIIFKFDSMKSYYVYKYKFSKLIFIHFLNELVAQMCFKIKALSMKGLDYLVKSN